MKIRTRPFPLSWKTSLRFLPRFGISIQNIHIIELPFIARKEEGVEETLLGFFRFDPVITQMLDVAILLVFIVPFKNPSQAGSAIEMLRSF